MVQASRDRLPSRLPHVKSLSSLLSFLSDQLSVDTSSHQIIGPSDASHACLDLRPITEVAVRLGIGGIWGLGVWGLVG